MPLLLSPASILAPRSRQVVSLDKRRGSIPLSPYTLMYLRLKTYLESIPFLFGFILRLHLLLASFIRLGAMNLNESMYKGMNPGCVYYSRTRFCLIISDRDIRTIIVSNQSLEFLCFTLYPHSFYLNSMFKKT